jgi:hypothetical protein
MAALMAERSVDMKVAGMVVQRAGSLAGSRAALLVER